MNSKKRILITGAGGSAAANFIRSLKKAPESFYFIGADCNKYYLQRAEVNEKHLIPKANEKDYLPILKEIIKDTSPDFLFSQVDEEIAVLSAHRSELNVKTFFPKDETIQICQDKFVSYRKWEEAGIKVPKTMLLHNKKDLEKAFSEMGGNLWIRETKGAFGKGSLPVTHYKQAEIWIDLYNGWGRFSASELLDSSQMITWQSIWNDGNLVVAQTRKRIYWEFGNRAPSGVTGLTGTGITTSDLEVDDLAQKCIFAVDNKPHGIFSVDMTYDKKNSLYNPTEINIGRFFTTHLFFTEAGLNMPYIFVSLAFDKKPPHFPKKINPLSDNLAWVRGLDYEPILTTMSEIDKYELELEKHRKKVAQ